MQEHSQYEELCAQAGVGQISAEELSELQAHMEICNFCKDLQTEFVEISSLWLTQAQKLEPEVYDPQSALRKNILRKLESAGAEFSAPVQKEIGARPDRISKFRFESFHSLVPIWTVALVVVASAVGFGVGSLRHSSSTPEKVTVAAVPTPSAPIATPEKKIPTPQVDNAPLLAAQRAEADLQQKLAASEAEKVRLQSEMGKVTQQIAAVQQAKDHDASELAELKATADQDHTAAVTAEAQLRTLKEGQDSKDAELVVAQYHLRELEGKLSEQSAVVARDRQVAALASGSEMRDVIGSRNLHIIDVADVDNSGIRKPFGRVFYTEGKSLIFYAYDLANTKGKQTFYAWGHREGDPHATRALGALVNDDQAQRRWVFRFNDTKVLAQIDSVSVTMEPSDSPGDKPRGKKLLNAFLGTPANHP